MASTATIDGTEFTWYVQSAFKVKIGGKTVWIDPHRLGDAEVAGDKADVIFITHSHPDHMDVDALKACASNNTVIVTTPSVAAEIAGQLPHGLQVVSIAAGEEAEQAGLKARAVAGYNEFHLKGEGCGFVISARGKSIFHAGDTNNVPEFAQIGPVDVALYPIGGTYTSDEENAAEAMRVIRPKTAVPMHYGYATGGDPARFRELVGDAAQVVILDPVLDVKYG